MIKCSSVNRLKKSSNRTSKYFIVFCNPKRLSCRGKMPHATRFFCQHSNINGFLCEFRSREYFERVMLTNSVIWQCSLTGRSDLTYAEALDSEKAARKLLRQFPSALRGPIILVASLTRRSTLKQLVDDVFSFVKDRYFKVVFLNCCELKIHYFHFWAYNQRMRRWMQSMTVEEVPDSAKLSK